MTDESRQREEKDQKKEEEEKESEESVCRCAKRQESCEKELICGCGGSKSELAGADAEQLAAR